MPPLVPTNGGRDGVPQMAPNVGGVASLTPKGADNVLMTTVASSLPLHPDVRFKKLAFYDVLNTLIKPSALLPLSNELLQESSFYFALTPQQATDIASYHDKLNNQMVDHSIQVQVRFCLLETSGEQEDCLPPSVSLKVNNKLCQLTHPNPFNVTANVKLSPFVRNNITVHWRQDKTRAYCIAVYLVRKLTSSQLLHHMKSKGVKHADYTRALIKEKLTEHVDCEIHTRILKVSLICPLGKTKMSIPCRASTCSTHLQGFDASIYLQMNDRKPTWICPVCHEPAAFKNLIIDGYFQEILASSLLKPDDTEILLHIDGSFSTQSMHNESQIVQTPTKPTEIVEVISEDNELIITNNVKPIKRTLAGSSSAMEPTSTLNWETVDLTVSDDDDDQPLPKRRPNLLP